MSRSQGAGRAWCQADEGCSRVPAPWPPARHKHGPAWVWQGRAPLYTSAHHTLARGAPPGGLPLACPPTDQPVLVPVPPRGCSAAHLRGCPAAWESWASPGEGHPPDTTALPTRGPRLRVWACQVEQDIPALPTRVNCTKSERHHFLLNMFHLRGDRRGASLWPLPPGPPAAAGAGQRGLRT